MPIEVIAGAGPLTGLRVVELGTLIAAPFATRMLGDFGAEIIKIESPGGGDPLRKWRKLHQGTSLWWYLQSRNKKSVTLDLKSAEGQDIVRRLIAQADILVENFRPGTLEKWGLGWEELSKINPKLVMVRISGFGQTGPYANRPGFGAIGEAMGGIRHTTGSADRAPARTGVSLGDSLASLHAVIGALMCVLRVKTLGGQGQVVDVSLTESIFNIMESLIPEYDLLGEVRTRTDGKLPGIVPSNTYRTKDARWVVVAGNGDSIYRRLMVVIERPDLAASPDLQSNDGRVLQEQMIDTAIQEWVGRHPLDTVLAAFQTGEIPSSAIYTAADIVADAQYQAREMVLSERLPDGTAVKMPGVVPKLSGTPGRVGWLGPTLGAHTREVLTGLGMSHPEIDALKAAGTI